MEKEKECPICGKMFLSKRRYIIGESIDKEYFS